MKWIEVIHDPVIFEINLLQVKVFIVGVEDQL